MQHRRPITKIVYDLLIRTLAGSALAILAGAGAQAATPTSTTLTVNATGTLGGASTVAFTGTATLTNIGSGTFAANADITTFATTPTPFTITLTTGTTGTLTGTINLANFVGGSGSGSATITGGTGNLSGATGSFPNLNGTLGIGLSFTLTFSGSGTVTIGGGGGTTGPAPTISQVLNNYGLIPAGFSNSGIAPGTLFILKGANLADPNAQPVLQDSTKGLPTTLNGASVKVTVGSTTTIPVFYYSFAAQLALVLPSNTPIGNATVTVTYGGQTSAPASFQVVKSSMGFDAYYGTGSGMAVATSNATGQLYDYTHSIPPGTTIVLWGSGLGADAARDNTYVGSGFAINNLAHIYIGGVDTPILYQGASGFPGLNQIDVTVPAGVTTGCNVALVGVNTDGVPTNYLSLPIGNGVCSDPAYGITGTQLQTGSGQGSFNSGSVQLSHSITPAVSGGGTQTFDIASASFQTVSGLSFVTGGNLVSIGGCIVNETLYTGTIPHIVGLDAGTITVSGPGGSTTLTEALTGLYSSQLASGFIPSSGGTFNISGTGGSGVGAFNASLNFPSPFLVWTNTAADSTITLASGATFNWTGGAPNSYVSITGSSVNTTSGTSGSFTCLAPVAAGTFTVPSYVLAGVPAGTGSASLGNNTGFGSFTAPHIDSGFLSGSISQQINVTYK